MLETRATIIRLAGKEAIVQAVQGGGCGSCGGGKSCGSSKLNQVLSVRPRQFRVRNETGAGIGEEVQLAVPEGALLRSALILYAIPLLLLFVGAAAGQHWLGQAIGHDAGAALGALAGLISGFLLAWFLAARQRNAVAALPCVVATGAKGEPFSL